MKIFMVNKFFYHYGGTESHVFGLSQMLNDKGHQVIPFGMQHEDNKQEFDSEYFVKKIDYETNSLIEKIHNAAKLLYSLEAKKKIRKLIEKTKPDIAHLHNIYHQLSPSILGELKKCNIPMVMTVHDLKLVCPNYKFLHQGTICEKCYVHRYYHAIIGRCIKNSFIGSTLCAVEMYLHKLFHLYDSIDKFIFLSDFYKMKFIEFGFPADKLIFLPNYVPMKEYIPSRSIKNYFIYLGRLVPEKGLKTLIKAMKKIKGYELYIIGDGPERRKLEAELAEGGDNSIKFLGFQSGESLLYLAREAMFMVIPSEWYENSPRSVLEGLSMGLPVIASNVGGLPELVEDGVNGLIFEIGNADDLSEKILYLINNPDKRREMGKRAREKIEREHNPELFYERTVAIYQSLINRAKPVN